MKKLRSRLSYANVISTLALFLVLTGGAAYAANQLAKNSVGTKQLKKNAVTSAKVKNHSLQAADFKQGQLPAGARGAKGDTGLQGVPGNSEPPVIDATTGPVPISTAEGASVPLSGDTTWSAPPGKVGTLLVQGEATVATNQDETPESCSFGVNILDNGKLVEPEPPLLFSTDTLHDPAAATPKQLIESFETGIGVVNPGITHTITATFFGEGKTGCAPGSEIEDVRVVVIPLG